MFIERSKHTSTIEKQSLVDLVEDHLGRGPLLKVIIVKKNLPPLNWLRSFQVSARHMNFTQAAVELNLTQAAISQQVKGLESNLGVTLFKRLPRGLELTQAGRAYLPSVIDSIERLATATDEIFGEGRNRILTVCVSLVFLNNWLSGRLGRFRKLHPEVRLRFTSNIWFNDQSHESDMEVYYGKGDRNGCISNRLTWDELFPVCSPTFYKDNMRPSSPSELNKHDLLHVIGYEEGWGYWLNNMGYRDVDCSQGIQFDTLIIALKMSVMGQGIALGRTSLVEELIAQGELIVPFEQSLATSEAFYLSSPAAHIVHPHAEAFRSWILAEAEAGRRDEKM
ncbi:MAG: LysR family glycine cleavage system transcriptional activator [Candidatus Endobugula sp.]|jgi:LysR family glycine cleavage system transcriptional activator